MYKRQEHTLLSLHCELNPGPPAHESQVLATRPPGGSELLYTKIKKVSEFVVTVGWVYYQEGARFLIERSVEEELWIVQYAKEDKV